MKHLCTYLRLLSAVPPAVQGVFGFWECNACLQIVADTLVRTAILLFRQTNIILAHLSVAAVAIIIIIIIIINLRRYERRYPRSKVTFITFIKIFSHHICMMLYNSLK